MLPFLKQKQEGVATLTVKTRQPDETSEESDHDAAIHACAVELISAVHAHDTKGAAEALRSAFEILDSMPHEEGEHTSPHTYEDQKED